MNDMLNYAMHRACGLFGGRSDGVFNAACLSHAIVKITGRNQLLDGEIIRFILAGRPDVEVLSGGAHFQMVRWEQIE